jgi:hypothetical protein
LVAIVYRFTKPLALILDAVLAFTPFAFPDDAIELATDAPERSITLSFDFLTTGYEHPQLFIDFAMIISF